MIQRVAGDHPWANSQQAEFGHFKTFQSFDEEQN